MIHFRDSQFLYRIGDTEILNHIFSLKCPCSTISPNTDSDCYMLNGVMLSVVMLNVVAPPQPKPAQNNVIPYVIDYKLLLS